MNTICRNCGDSYAAPERPCPKPAPGVPFVDCGRGGHMFDVQPKKTYEERAAEIGRLVQSKQAAYGDAFGKSGAVLRILYPDGITPDKLDDALVIVRVLDKLFRIATDRDALGESPWQDVAGYALLALVGVESARG